MFKVSPYDLMVCSDVVGNRMRFVANVFSTSGYNHVRGVAGRAVERHVHCYGSLRQAFEAAPAFSLLWTQYPFRANEMEESRKYVSPACLIQLHIGAWVHFDTHKLWLRINDMQLSRGVLANLIYRINRVRYTDLGWEDTRAMSQHWAIANSIIGLMIGVIGKED